MPRNTLPPRRRPINWKQSCKCKSFVHSQVDGKDVCNTCRRPITPARMESYRQKQRLRALNTLAGVDD